jgi:predicted neuraminidase
VIIFLFFVPDEDEGKYMTRNSYKLLGVLFLIVAVYLSAFAPCYFRTSVEEELSLDRASVTKHDVYNAAVIVSSEIEKLDGSIRMLARSSAKKLTESYSFDKGISWTDAKFTNIESPDTRIFVARTPSGRILLVNNDSSKSRCNMCVYLSEDDGANWKYKRHIDERDNLSYPDVDFYNGKIYLTYDRERCGIGSAREILFMSFTEDDIMNNNYVFTPSIISKSDFPVENYE